MLSKMIQHFKGELKAANQKSTEDQIKVNNLQSRLPKVKLNISYGTNFKNDCFRVLKLRVLKLNILARGKQSTTKPAM